MKDEFVAILILALLFGMFFFNSYAMESKTKKMTEIIDQAETKTENKTLSRKDAEKLKNEWEKEKKILMYFSAHGNIKEIDECVDLFLEYCEPENHETALYNLKKAKHHLKDLAQREKIRLDNIF